MTAQSQDLAKLSRHDALIRLRQKYPRWDVWYVPLHPTGTSWCAKPKGTATATHHAYSPEELDADLTSA